MIVLAARLRALTDERMAAALGLREFAHSGVRDYFDLAEALLSTESIQAALATLDRTRLAVLAVAGELAAELGPDAEPSTADIAARLSELGHSTIDEASVRARAERLDELLLGTLSTSGDGAASFTPFSAVRTHMADGKASGLPSTADLAIPYPLSAVAAAMPADTRFVDRLAAERAFGTTSVVAELVTSLIGEPARELARGGLSLPDAKRLAHDASIPLEEVPRNLGLAARAGLVERDGALWQSSDAGEAWLLGGSAERWRTLAEAWHTGLAPDVRTLLAGRATQPWGEPLAADVKWIFPAAGAELQQRIDNRVAEAELLGLTAGGTPSAAGSALLAQGPAEAQAAMTELLPPEVSTLYLQHDLTAVAPGPLTPQIDARLRGMAEVESREVASSYRFTTASINKALAAGDTAEGILAFLGEISLSGMPQPLEYLVRESAERYGRLRVGPVTDEDHMKSAVRSDDAALIHTVSVDHSLSTLGLRLSGPYRLLSHFPPEVLFWALNDARYPVAAENALGDIVHPTRRRHTPVEVEPAVDPLIALVATLRESDADTEPTGQAWLARQIDLAIRAKQTLIVSVRMPGGEVSDYHLEPASVANGRLRARDRRADIERTLPLSSIAAIASV